MWRSGIFSLGRIHKPVAINGFFFVCNKCLKKYLNWQKVSIGSPVFFLKRPQVLILESTHGFDSHAHSRRKTFCFSDEGVSTTITNRTATWSISRKNGILAPQQYVNSFRLPSQTQISMSSVFKTTFIVISPREPQEKRSELGGKSRLLFYYLALYLFSKPEESNAI